MTSLNNQREERVYSLSLEYGRAILTKWLLLRELNEVVHENILFEREDVNTLMTYINKLLSLYMEIYPKVETRNDLFDNDFIKEYTFLKKYYDNRKLLLEPEHAEQIYTIESKLGFALAKFGILDFEV